MIERVCVSMDTENRIMHRAHCADIRMWSMCCSSVFGGIALAFIYWPHNFVLKYFLGEHATITLRQCVVDSGVGFNLFLSFGNTHFFNRKRKLTQYTTLHETDSFAKFYLHGI